MLFHSLEFAVFLPVVFAIYWLVPRKRIQLQNLVIVAASYVFYGWWDWRFLGLLIGSSVGDFVLGILIGSAQRKSMRLVFLWISIAVNAGLLVFFKYYDFFVGNFVDAFTIFGYRLHISTLRVILPVGISFYTFQSLSYTIDVYRGALRPTRRLLEFLAYVSFFPQLVAGPIERATHLLPQFSSERTFDTAAATDGMRQILWGLFKKIVIADNCAYFADEFFGRDELYPGSVLFLGAFFFTFQIYCDFSAYSDIAIGTARLFGFHLMRNFAYPYFSRNIAEFWRKWHISLTTWFRDYVYLPLGGSRGGKLMRIRNIIIVFLLSGMWHGANWTFIVWGALNAAYYIPLLLTGGYKSHFDVAGHGRKFPTMREFAYMIGTMLLVLTAWIFFRAESVSQAMRIIGRIVSPSILQIPLFEGMKNAVFTLAFICVLLVAEWNARTKQHPLQDLGVAWSRPARHALYYALIVCLYLFGGKEREFIYFQF